MTAGYLENISMQAVPVGQIRMLIPHTAGRQKGVTHQKEPINRGWEKRDGLPPTGIMARPVVGIVYVVTIQTVPWCVMSQAQP